MDGGNNNGNNFTSADAGINSESSIPQNQPQTEDNALEQECNQLEQCENDIDNSNDQPGGGGGASSIGISGEVVGSITRGTVTSNPEVQKQNI